MDLKSQSQTIRQNFRKEIRRKQINEMFSTKRRMMQEENKQLIDSQILERYNLEDLYESLKNRTNIEETLVILVHFLYTKDSLRISQEKYGVKKMEELCIQITHLIFNSIMPNFSSIDEKYEENRKKCLIVISNIVADDLAPVSQLISIIIEGIENNCSGVERANNEETIEVGWIIANVFCHPLDLSIEGELEKPIEQLLTLAQDIIMAPDLDLISHLSTNLDKFFKHVDNFFNSESQYKSQTQHFKLYRLVLLQNTINCNLHILNGSVLTNIIPFIDNNLTYLSCYEEKIIEVLCKKCFEILKHGCSDKIMDITIKLVKKLTNNRDIVVMIIKDYIEIILKILMFSGFNLKIQAIRLLGSLCVDEEMTEFIADKKQIEFIISQSIKSIRDRHTLIELILLTDIIVTKTKHKHGKLAITAIEDCLTHKEGELGTKAIKVVENYEHITGEMN